MQLRCSAQVRNGETPFGAPGFAPVMVGVAFEASAFGSFGGRALFAMTLLAHLFAGQ
jgi:hypothetical protein